MQVKLLLTETHIQARIAVKPVIVSQMTHARVLLMSTMEESLSAAKAEVIIHSVGSLDRVKEDTGHQVIGDDRARPYISGFVPELCVLHGHLQIPRGQVAQIARGSSPRLANSVYRVYRARSLNG